MLEESPVRLTDFFDELDKEQSIGKSNLNIFNIPKVKRSETLLSD